MDIRDKRIVLPNVICLYTIRISEMIDEHARCFHCILMSTAGMGWALKGEGGVRRHVVSYEFNTLFGSLGVCVLVAVKT